MNTIFLKFRLVSGFMMGIEGFVCPIPLTTFVDMAEIQTQILGSLKLKIS